MIAAYAIAVGLGFAGLVVAAVQPAQPSATVRRGVAGAIAFGMGGLSASFAGWSPALAAVVAVLAAGAMIVYADRVGADAD